jgi:hypothetical protein
LLAASLTILIRRDARSGIVPAPPSPPRGPPEMGALVICGVVLPLFAFCIAWGTGHHFYGRPA